MGRRFRKFRSGRRPNSFFGYLLLAVGVVLAAYQLGLSLERFKTRDRTLSVKGLSEKLVKADLAIWQLNFKSSGNDLTAVEKKMTEDKVAVTQFLKGLGFTKDEIEEGSVSVVDKWAREWSDVPKDKTFRFIIETSVSVRSKNVDLVSKSPAKIGSLIRSGVAVAGEPSYYYTQFLELKPQMLREASQNALHSATEMVDHSGAHLGGIREAQQGLFTIKAKDTYNDQQAVNEAQSIEKRTRVVTTVVYNLL